MRKNWDLWGLVLCIAGIVATLLWALTANTS